MLVLTRKFGESVVIGDDIRVTVLQIKGGQVKIGIEAPEEVKIYREELGGPKDNVAPSEESSAPAPRNILSPEI